MKPQHIFEEIKLEPLMLHLAKNYDADKGRMIFWIDLFAGAGGTTTGIHLAGLPNVKVVACVNHDMNALLSHWKNHPECMHFVEDVRDFRVVQALRDLVDRLRKEFPGCLINLWASLECTNYSKAKGGLPRDADSRTLAHALFMYVEELQPDYIYIENVREFMSWGPLDAHGRPVSKLNGQEYIRWTNKVKGYGYRYDKQLINSADFGAYTSRERYFGQFAKHGLPIAWPEPTHSKSPAVGGLFGAKAKWKPVREVLNLEDEGRSIFTRSKPLSEKTLERIYAGLVKFVAGGEDLFTMQYNSGNDKHRVKSFNEPVGTLTTSNSHAVVKSVFLSKYFSGDPKNKNISVERPAGAITTKDSHAAVFLSHYYGNGFNTSLNDPCPTITTKERIAKIETSFLLDYQYKSNAHSLDKPAPTIMTKDKLAAMKVNFMDQQYGNSKPSSMDDPAGTVTANPKFNLVSADRFLLNPQYFNKGGSLDKPCFTLIARMDKMPPYLVSASSGKIFAMPLFDRESETMKKIRMFMAIYGIVDIKMRMLVIDELLRIQGFPEGYQLEGTQTERKKFIGNAVVPLVAKALILSNTKVIELHYERIAV